MREYTPSWADSTGEMSRARYHELKAFCEQYSERKREAALLLGPRGASLSHALSGTGFIDQTLRTVEKREKLLRENELIDQCLNSVCDGVWADALRKNICQGIAFHHIDKLDIPTSDRNAYFRARKAFFMMLDEMR